MAHETTKAITLSDYHNEVAPRGVTYLWMVGTAYPAGVEYRHAPDDDGEDCCDLPELVGELGLWGLAGTIDEDGRWCWNGKGEPRDHKGNSIVNVMAGFGGAW